MQHKTLMIKEIFSILEESHRGNTLSAFFAIFIVVEDPFSSDEVSPINIDSPGTPISALLA
jgi:hypothetical protein